MSFNYYTLLLHDERIYANLIKIFCIFERRLHFIIENEGYDRSYYSGFIGWLDPKGKTDLYVNLRCMNILPQTFTLYAGGGLLAASQLEDEWQETEDKLDTMRRIVGNL